MNNIILIGFMGCGKSSIGRRLSRLWQWEFIDTDKRIEEEQQKTIAEIFAEEGEVYFRNLETEVLNMLLKKERNNVISVGGGLPLLEENRKLLQKLGCSIYLKVTAETVCERLKDDATRPLLQGESKEKRVRELLEGRSRFYQEAADYSIDTEGKTIEQVVEDIREIVKRVEGN